MRTRFTPLARAQFLAALAHIHRARPSAARSFREAAQRQLRRLQDFPESGRAIPEFPEIPYRELIVTPYRFFYRVKGNTIWVVGVWHGAQLPEDPGTSA